MLCIYTRALILLLILGGVSCDQSWYPRTSPPQSPSHYSHSTGMLDDIVNQALRRPTRPAQSSQTHAHAQPAHPAQSSLTQTHNTQPQTHAPQLAHTHAHAQPQTHASPHPAPVGGLTTSKTTSDRLHLIGASAQPPPLKVTQPRRKPSPYQLKHARKPYEPKGRPMGRPIGTKIERWWNKPGGGPPRRMGTSPDYESKKAWREKAKLKGNPTDEHPSQHQQPHKGGGPGSPGAGSHAVSRRSGAS